MQEARIHGRLRICHYAQLPGMRCYSDGKLAVKEVVFALVGMLTFLFGCFRRVFAISSSLSLFFQYPTQLSQRIIKIGQLRSKTSCYERQTISHILPTLASITLAPPMNTKD